MILLVWRKLSGTEEILVLKFGYVEFVDVILRYCNIAISQCENDYQIFTNKPPATLCIQDFNKNLSTYFYTKQFENILHFKH